MATSTLLSNPAILVNAIDLSDQCTAAVFTRTIEALESSAFGSTSRVYTAGLENSSLEMTLYNSYAASETYATLKALVGTQVTVKANPAAGANTVLNPQHVLTGAYLEELPLLNSQLGALDSITITFTGGVYTVVTA